jgi:glycosyltransferase involved in cell wall biosynthesis
VTAAVRGRPDAACAEAATATRRRSVVFIARSLEIGGAERQLALLARGLSARGHEVTVLTFYPGGAFECELEGAGIDVRCLGKRGRWDVGRFGRRLAAELRALRPDVVHGYLDVPNLLAVLAKPLLRDTRIVWGIRYADLVLSDYDWPTHILYRVLRGLSGLPDAVIVNSHAGAEHHSAVGYAAKAMHVIPNAIDTTVFQPDNEARSAQRAQWRVRPNDILIGLAGRLDPAKDHDNFMRAAALLAPEQPFRFVCIGGGTAAAERRLRELSSELGLESKLHWAGEMLGMTDAYNALDVLCSASASEGFPNAIGEAMACGLPCVATDAGDSATIVGGTGVIVAPGDASALAAGMLKVAATCRTPAVRAAARERIARLFSVEQLLDQTEAVLWAAD